MHDLPWMLFPEMLLLDPLDCSTALDCLLPWDLGQPTPSPGPPPLDPSPLWIHLLAFNLYRGYTCTSQPHTGVLALPCGFT